MIEKSLWHPVGKLQDLTGGPHALTVLGEEVVVWQASSGAFQAWADRCPHRGTKLSLGQVVDGRLECAYHGWQFDSGGQCKVVPALPDFVPPASQRACTYATQEQSGLLWVQMAPGKHVLPLFAAEEDQRLRKVNSGPYAVNASAPRISHPVRLFSSVLADSVAGSQKRRTASRPMASTVASAAIRSFWTLVCFIRVAAVSRFDIAVFRKIVFDSSCASAPPRSKQAPSPKGGNPPGKRPACVFGG